MKTHWFPWNPNKTPDQVIYDLLLQDLKLCKLQFEFIPVLCFAGKMGFGFGMKTTRKLYLVFKSTRKKHFRYTLKSNPFSFIFAYTLILKVILRKCICFGISFDYWCWICCSTKFNSKRIKRNLLCIDWIARTYVLYKDRYYLNNKEE